MVNHRGAKTDSKKTSTNAFKFAIISLPTFLFNTFCLQRSDYPNFGIDEFSMISFGHPPLLYFFFLPIVTGNQVTFFLPIVKGNQVMRNLLAVTQSQRRTLRAKRIEPVFPSTPQRHFSLHLVIVDDQQETKSCWVAKKDHAQLVNRSEKFIFCSLWTIRAGHIKCCMYRSS